MSKAILIMDMPESCNDCDIQFSDNYSDWCPHRTMLDDIYEHITNNTKPDNCPLKSVPEKLSDADLYDEYDTGYQHGWNGCLKKIIGE